MRRIAVFLIAWIAVMPGTAPVRAADTTSAVVSGADLLYVRRGPSTSFPALATLERGQRVEVERLEGVWAVVRLASGEHGYVHSTFLSFPGAPPSKLFVAPSPSPTATRPAEPTPSATATTTANETPSPARADTATRTPRDDATPTRAVSAPAARDTDPNLATLRVDIQRLTVAVEALQKSVADTPASGGLDEHPWRSPAIWLVILVALVIGWVAGSAYGRQTERSRRNRIRF